MILELEQAIATRIRQAVSRITQVVEFPDEPEGLGRPVQRSRIVFGYQRSSFRWTAEKSYEKTLFFEAIFQCKNLRTHQDPCYELLDGVSMALIGWRPFAIATRDIEQTDERFLSFGEGVWIYSQTYSLTVTISEAVREVLTPIEETRIDEDERDRRREEFFRQYLTPIGVVLPPHIEVVCGLWRSRIGKVADQENSELEAVFRTGGLTDLSLGTDEVREQD